MKGRETMIVHIMHHEKFTKPFIDFINTQFCAEEHTFLITSDNCKDAIYSEYSNIVFIRNNRFVFKKYKPYMHDAEKIIIHGLFNPNLIVTLAIHKKHLNRTYWDIWGGDLYNKYRIRKKDLKTKIIELLRKKVIKNIGHVITYLEDDYYLLKKWYKTKAKLHLSFMYPSNLFYKTNNENFSDNISEKNVLVGNFASSTNNHIEIFNKLRNQKNINIFVVLSYGDMEYAKLIEKKGFEIFGRNFYPITNFIKHEKYIDFLSTIDIAIFNHNRQEGFGNLVTLLGLGKKFI